MLDLSVRRWEAPREGHKIYFLVLAGDVVYVGQTQKLEYRLGQHRAEKLFDEVWSFDAQADLVDGYEMLLIAAYQPLYNDKGVDRREKLRARAYARQPWKHLAATEIAL